MNTFFSFQNVIYIMYKNIIFYLFFLDIKDIYLSEFNIIICIRFKVHKKILIN